MFIGTYNIQVNGTNGKVFANSTDEDLMLFIDEIEKKSGQLCYAYLVYYSEECCEIQFTFEENDNSEYDKHKLLYSFRVPNSKGAILNEIYVPKEYISYFADKKAYFVGLRDCFSLLNTYENEKEDPNLTKFIEDIFGNL